MKILFAQGNLLRKEEFRIQTTIYEEKNNLFVKKEALSEKAFPHIKNMSKNYQILKKNGLNLPKLIKGKKNKIILEYLNYSSIAKLIEISLYEKNFNRVKELANLIYIFINSLSQITTNPNKNEGFIKIFGKNLFKSNKNIQCLKIGIVDLNADNILCDEKNNKFYLVDWEWCFEFPIPLEFILIRTFFYISLYLQSLLTISVNKTFPLYEVLKNFYMPKIFIDKLNLNPQKLQNFLLIEYHFQKYVNTYALPPNENYFLKKFSLVTSCNFQYQHFSKNESNKEQTIDLLNEINKLRNENSQLKNNLSKIQSSKTYKLWQAYCKIRDKLFKNV